jgi:hypothetical protein
VVSAKATTIAAELTWGQVHAFRLARHHLAARRSKRDLAKVAGAIGGAQAQLMSAAELQLAVRVACTTADVRTALWKDRSLVKTWLMRGTLHLIPAEDLPLYSAALGPRWIRPTKGWFQWAGMTEKDLAKFVDTIGGALNGEPMTREEIIATAAKGHSKNITDWLRSSWGGMLKPVARSGQLCFGPSRGTNVTFVNPRLWLRSWREMDPEEALLEVARRYLRAYGPATSLDFARWFAPSLGGPAVRAAWSGLANEVVPVSVDGVRADMLARDVNAILRIPVGPSVRLLPLFDPYLMGHASRDHLFDRVHRWKVSRVAGWISAVVLVDGRVVGTWMHSVTRGTLRITVTPFGRLSPRIRSGIQERAEAIADSLGLENVDVAIARDRAPLRRS